MSEESEGLGKKMTIFIVGSFIIWFVFMIALNEAESPSEIFGFFMVGLVAKILLIWSLSEKSSKE